MDGLLWMDGGRFAKIVQKVAPMHETFETPKRKTNQHQPDSDTLFTVCVPQLACELNSNIFWKNQPQNGEITGFTILKDSKAGFEQIYVDLRFSGFADASNSLGIQDFIIKRCNVIVVEFLRANENRITFHCQIFQERRQNEFLFASQVNKPAGIITK